MSDEFQISRALARQLNGAEFFCCAITWFLQACIVMSTWQYYFGYRHKTDSAWLKGLVAALLVITSAAAFVNSAWLYQLFVVFRDVPHYNNSSLQASTPIFIVISGSLVHAFFVHRCWRLLNKPNWLLIVTAPPWLFGLVAGCYVSHFIASRSAYTPALKGINTAWISCWLVLDIGITSALIWRMVLFKKDSPFPSTVQLIRRLILLSFATCFFITCAQCAFLILNYQVAFDTSCPSLQTISRLQVISLLANLASRPADGQISHEYSLPNFVSLEATNSSSSTASTANVPIHRMPIYVSKEQHTVPDLEKLDAPCEINYPPKKDGDLYVKAM